MTPETQDPALLEDLIRKARAAGADSADALVARSTALSHAQRMGELEQLEREESQDVGLRVFIGKRQAIVSSTDLNAKALDELVERAVTMARVVPEDPYCGLADPEQLARQIPDVESCDPVEPSPEDLIERARLCEEAARAVEGVTNSEGAEAGWGMTRVSLAASNDFTGSYRVSSHSVGVSVLAGEGLDMQRDYDFSSKVFASDLEDPTVVGRRAGERAVRRLNPVKPKTGRVPIVYESRVANSLLRHFLGAISGPSIARGTSFLKDRMDKPVFAEGIRIIDEPHRKRGLRSRPFDSDGLPTRTWNLIEDGRLTTWLLDLSSARQLGLEPTGHASRGTSSPPGPSASNVYLEPGRQSPEEIIADIEDGFYVTEMIGMGVNGVTGDYSRGASGYWIKDGKLTHPVSEATIAGNLKDMFANLTPASDLKMIYGIDAPTLRVDGMMVAGS
ncbi:TldD/PmbA family protein [Fodinicurvata fenggangensis]|uniref:TldD/PmbA family protein n=1 Tax=Fodinicurvata fenggangensis TaxID=1121830 RepID=UPI00047D4BED|nr:TldD/PmbA family protein [Fodinicurvata fenggangensis]